MSPPVAAPTVTVRPDTVEALAAELAALAGELSDEAALCRSTATSLYTALSGDEGLAAGSAATAWAVLAEVVGARSEALGRTLVAAVGAYRATDRSLAERIASGRSDAWRGDR